jgi:hypothetical protein
MSTCGHPTRILFAAQELAVKIKEIERELRSRAGKAARNVHCLLDNAPEYLWSPLAFSNNLPGLAGRVGLLNRLLG